MSILGEYSQDREVVHPLTGDRIDRRHALTAAIVPPDLQARISRERELRGLAPADLITAEERRRYNATMVASEDRSRHPFELGTGRTADQMRVAFSRTATVQRDFMSSVLNSLWAEKDILVSLHSPNSMEAGGSSEEGGSGDGNYPSAYTISIRCLVFIS